MVWGSHRVDELPVYEGLTTKERQDVIRDPWLVKGESASTIARKYFAPGVTRNQIIGIINRSPWVKEARQRKAAQPKPVAAAKPRIMRDIKTKPHRHLATIVVRQAGPRTDWTNQFRAPIEGTEPISLLELPFKKGGKCRFPVIGGYCGIGTEHMYCDEHRRIMYRNPGEPEPE